MAFFTFAALMAALSPAALTVRAQTVSPNDRGALIWDRYMPREDVPSIRMADIVTLDDRPAADRREWNAPGRRIPLATPSYKEMEMVPIEAEDVIDEREMQLLNEQTGGNGAIILDLLQARLPARVDRLGRADYRRLEIDVFQAWLNGTIIIRNPQDASKTYTASYQIDSARYITAPTAWNDNSVNAYNLFLQFMEDAVDAVGPIEGAGMRLATLKAIQADAPNPFGNTSPQLTREELRKRIEDELGFPFRFDIVENTHQPFDDGGLTKTTTKVWTAHKVAAIPVGGMVGRSGFAPVVRASQMANALPSARIDSNGVAVYYLERNDGKELAMQAQLNAFPLPSEQLIYVVDAGV
jgi:hypothetical protein